MSKASDFFGSSGGGGLPINGVHPLNVNGVELYEDTSGASWLRSGVVENDSVTYPDASTIFDGVIAKTILTLFDPTLGIAYRNGKYLRLQTIDKVIEHDLDGTNPVQVINATTHDSNVRGIDYADNFVWLVGENNDVVIKYNDSNVYDSTISTSPETTTGTDITILGSSMYIINASSSIHKRNSTTGAAELLQVVDLTGYSGIAGITSKNNMLYVLFSNTNSTSVVKEFNPTNLLPTGREFSVENATSNLNNGLGINTDNGNLLYNREPDLYEYTFGDLIGIKDAKTNTDTGLPIYTRIK